MQWTKRLTALGLTAVLTAGLTTQALAARADYSDRLWEGKDRGQWADPWEADRAEAKVAHGGTDRGVDVMLDGQCLDFGDSRPVNQNGTVLVPVRVLLEAMDAEQITFDGATKTMTASGHGATLVQQAGTDLLTVTVAGETTAVTMDRASFLRKNTLYVPIRDVAKAMGYEVFWDQAYKTVVLMDPYALVDEIDSRFTKLNAALRPDNLGDIVEQIVAYTVQNGDETPESTTSVTTRSEDGFRTETTTAAQSQVVLYDAAQDCCYLALGAERDGVWLQTPYTDSVTQGLVELPTSVGSYLYDASTAYSVFDRYDTLMQSADALALLLGDDAFVQEDGLDVLDIGSTALATVEQALGLANPEAETDVQLRLTLLADGWTLTGHVGDTNISLTVTTRTADQPLRTTPPTGDTIYTEADLMTMGSAAFPAGQGNGN
jgi:hypothetical protein